MAGVPGSGAAPGSAPGRQRRRAVLLAAALVVVVGLGLVGWRVGVLDGLVGPARPAPSAAVPAEPAAPPVLGAVAGTPPTAAGVQAALDAVLGRSAVGGQLGVSVLDLGGGQVLYGQLAGTSLVPASTMKLVTAFAVLGARGPAYRLATRAVAGTEPGDVVLVGGGDPTLSVDGGGTYPSTARLDTLAREVRAALGDTRPRRVVVDATLFTGPLYGPEWDSDIPTGGHGGAVSALMLDAGRVRPRDTPPTPRSTEPDLAAGRAFARLLGVGTVVRGTAPAKPSAAPAPATPAAPAPGAVLGTVLSPPVQRLVDIMLADSENVVAEALARQVALARDQPASFAGAGTALNRVLAEFGLPPDDRLIADGSGLSRANRISALQLARLVAKAGDTRRPALSGLYDGLPVAGWSGTLTRRFQAPAGTGRPGIGVVRAKTGTLRDVNAMAGVVTTADGRALAFAAVANNATLPFWETEAALDALAATLAGCGCR
uniref:D-alanyl-D-alanine carboxypeptidase/D-alanyl-D-alanine endopeptidase n=1 Tax=Pilimelia terevasa TaxID=53372 RepID=UPI003570ED6F